MYDFDMSRRSFQSGAAVVLSVSLRASLVLAQDMPRGQIVDEVRCSADPTQSYALYLPSN
jgi:hypothetical protein